MVRLSARPSTVSGYARSVNPLVLWLLIALIGCGTPLASYVHAQSNALTTWAVSIVLPPRLVAGKMATLAVLGVDGRLADGIAVDLGKGQHVKTDKTGRAFFSAPADVPVLIASAAGDSAAALIDA